MDTVTTNIIIICSFIFIMILGFILLYVYNKYLKKKEIDERDEIERQRQVQNQYQNELYKRLNDIDKLYYHPNKISRNRNSSDEYTKRSSLAEDYFNYSPNNSNSSMETYL